MSEPPASASWTPVGAVAALFPLVHSKHALRTHRGISLRDCPNNTSNASFDIISQYTHFDLNFRPHTHTTRNNSKKRVPTRACDGTRALAHSSREPSCRATAFGGHLNPADLPPTPCSRQPIRRHHGNSLLHAYRLHISIHMAAKDSENICEYRQEITRPNITRIHFDRNTYIQR